MKADTVILSIKKARFVLYKKTYICGLLSDKKESKRTHSTTRFAMNDNTRTHRGSLDPGDAEASRPIGRNYFLGIGVDQYRHFPALANAGKDVRDLATALQESYYFEAADTTLLVGAEASRRNILRALNDFRRRITADDRLLIYYAGHGLFDEGLGFWIPAEAERDDISGYVGNAEVREIVRNIPARHVLLISDSCFSASLLVRDASRDVVGAFSDFDRNPSRWVFISGKGVVSDGIAGKNSPFAGAILKHLHQQTEKAVNIAQLADRVTKEVRFNYEQQAEASPLYQAGHEGGQFVFRRRQTEDDFWATTQKVGTEGSLLAYLHRYPEGTYAAEAERQLHTLADKNAWAKTEDQDSASGYRTYLRKYPEGLHAAAAQKKLDALMADDQKQRDTRAWEEARHAHTIAAYRDYLRQYPQGSQATTAQEVLLALAEAGAWDKAGQANTSFAYGEYLRQYPNGLHVTEAQEKLEALTEDALWAEAQDLHTPLAYSAYLHQYPRGRYAAQAQALITPPPSPVRPPEPIEPEPQKTPPPPQEITRPPVPAFTTTDTKDTPPPALYKTLLMGAGAIVLVLLGWWLWPLMFGPGASPDPKTLQTPADTPVTSVQRPPHGVPKADNGTAAQRSTAQPSNTQPSNTQPPTVQHPTPNRPKPDPTEAEKRRIAQEQAAAQEQERKAEQARSDQRNAEAAKVTVRRLLKSAQANLTADEPDVARKKIQEAAHVPHLPESLKKELGQVLAYLSAGENEQAGALLRKIVERL